MKPYRPLKGCGVFDRWRQRYPEEVQELAQHSGPSSSESQSRGDRASSPAEAGWQAKDSRHVSLYSENVRQEPSSSEVVDRESIANLASTRGKWEAIFTSEPREDASPRPKKQTPKWEVRMPYAEKTSKGPDTVTSNNLQDSDPDSPTPEDHHHQEQGGVDMESAIEREIRLAMEREAMLRREQEERSRQLSQQSAAGPRGLSSMESSTESELQPSFHELAEADRGAQFFQGSTLHHHHQQQQEEDAEREEAMQRGYSVHQKQSAKSDVTESIIEREIRLQKEREAELARQRGGQGAPQAATVNVAADIPSPRQQPLTPEGEEESEGEMEVVVVEDIPYEEAISRYNHDGESRIAQELRELREREDEVRQLRERMHRTSMGADASQQRTSTTHPTPSSSTSSPAVKATSAKPTSTAPSYGGSKSTPTTPRGLADKPPTVSFSRSVHNSPRGAEPPAPTTPSPSKTPKPETPIEREIRLARERENELRRSKGLPELKPEPARQESVEEEEGEGKTGAFSATTTTTPRQHYLHASSSPLSQPDSTMRRFASNRLQQEMQVQRDREMKLRQEGKILSTSEEHILPQRYTQVVVAQDSPDGGSAAVKRNFRTPARRNSTASQDSNASGGAGEGTPRSQQQSSASLTPREGGGAKKATAGTGAVSFSYREFAQTAESKIERELREMREREEELRKLRSGGGES